MRRVQALALALVLMVLTVAPAAAREPIQTTDVYAFADLPTLVDRGDAWLHRSNAGVAAIAALRGAASGVYTMWWVVWNTPEGCFVPFGCGEQDLFNPDAGLAIGYAGGTIVGPGGNLVIAGHLTEGAAVTSFPYPEFEAIGVQLTESSMLDSRHAEIHIVIRSHGPMVRGLVASALRSFNGACVYEPPISGSEPAYGIPGPNACQDLYFAIFPSQSPS